MTFYHFYLGVQCQRMQERHYGIRGNDTQHNGTLQNDDNKMPLNKMTYCIVTKWQSDAQHKDTLQNEDSIMTLNIMTLCEMTTAKCQST